MITVTVSGPPGIGKTLLCKLLTVMLRAMGLNLTYGYGSDISFVGCRDQLARLNTEIRIVDSEG